MSPNELLTTHLNDYKKSLMKSRISVFYQKIDYPTHKTHKVNLTILINQYKEAIECLK